jgi:hypothetical protein
MRDLQRRFADAIPDDDEPFDAEWFIHEQVRVGMALAKERGLTPTSFPTAPARVDEREISDPRVRGPVQDAHDLVHGLMKSAMEPKS